MTIPNINFEATREVSASLAEIRATKHEISIADILVNSFRSYSVREAVVTSERSYSYNDLYKKSAEIVKKLLSHDIKPGEVVGVLLDRGFELIATVCGLIRHGCVYLPLDPNYPIDRLSFMASESGAKLILSNPKFESQVNQLTAYVSSRDPIWPCSDLEQVNQDLKGRKAKTKNGDVPVYIIYTSGTTGKPKGVPIYSNGLINFVFAQSKYLCINQHSRLIQNSSICFDMSVWEIFLTLCNGASIAVVGKETLQDGRDFARALNDFHVSHILLTPSMLSIVPHVQLPFLKCIVSAGEKCSQGMVDKWAPGRKFYDAYGATEATIYTTIGQCFEGQNERNVGYPMENTTIYVLDANLKALPAGEVGNVYIGGIGVSKGYINREALTRERFISSCFGTLYKTGDLGYLTTDGALVYKGRVDNQVKVNGYRIELEEIEATVNNDARVKGSHATVLSIGEKNNVIVLYVVYVELNAMSSRELKALLAEQLPRYMIPSFIVELPSFPLTGSGKINTKQLPMPQTRNGSILRSHNEPKSLLEYEISSIWSTLLGHESFTLEDSFFDVGGHSLLANQLFAKIEDDFGVILPVSTIFSHESIIDLSHAVCNKQSNHYFSPLVKLRNGGAKNVLYCIHPGGGSLFCYHELIKRLPDDWSVFGVQSKNCDFAVPIKYRSIENMASDYVQHILDNDDITELSLIGWSSGGLIAFEMARILHRVGVKVKFLGLLDSYISGRYVDEIDMEDRPLFVYRVIHGRLLESVPDTIRSKISCMAEDEAIQLIYSDAQSRGIVPKTVSLERVLRSVEIHKENCLASKGYQPEGYEQSVNLLRATSNDDFADNPFAGWEKVSLGQCKLVEVEADHYTIMDAPHIETVVNLIQA